jgi:hypothetical protein
MKKGAMEPILLIEVLGTSIVLVGILLSATGFTEDYAKAQTVDAKAERVKNAALALDTLSRGSIVIQMDGYDFRYDGEYVYIRYNEAEANASMESVKPSFASISGPSSYQEIGEETDLILEKTQSDDGTETLSMYVADPATVSGG